MPVPMIHPTALVDASARLGDGVTVGAFTTIGPGVELGEGCAVGAYVTLGGPSTIGARTRIGNYASVGTDSQDLKFRGGETFLRMGADNVVREYVTINRASDPGGATVIGDHNVFMAYVHVAHNSRIGSHVIMANAANIAGHVEIDDWAMVGGLVAVHQFCRIGAHALVGAGAKVVKDVAPFCMADGVPARLAGINVVGLRRRGFANGEVGTLRRAYVALFRRGQNLAVARGRLPPEIVDNVHVRRIVEFIERSRRGLAIGARRLRRDG